jgi:hypothetical protein
MVSFSNRSSWYLIYGEESHLARILASLSVARTDEYIRNVFPKINYVHYVFDKYCKIRMILKLLWKNIRTCIQPFRTLTRTQYSP